MMKQGYRKLLNQHGLRLKYNKRLKMSYAVKVYNDNVDDGALIEVWKRGDAFMFQVGGTGSWRAYFEREAQVLKNELQRYIIE